MFWQKIILKGITEIIVVKFIEKKKKKNLSQTCVNPTIAHVATNHG